MIININSKKMIEGEKPVFNFESISPVTIKTDQDFSSLSSSLYLAGSRAYGNSNKLLFLSKEYSINEDEVTFIVDTYTENYLKYINEFKTPFNLEFGAYADSKKIFLLDKAFANPRVYIEGVPPSHLPDFYTKEESDERFATLSGLNEVSGNLDTNYWNKYEVAQAIAQVETMDIEVLSALPPIEEAQEYTIYLVPAPSSEIGNFYDEYLVINGQFEQVGSTTIDMSQYVKRALSGTTGNDISWKDSTGVYNRLTINDDGFRWGDARNNAGPNFNVFGLETNMRGTSVRLGFSENSHIYHGGYNIENGPKGFVIQNASGGIDANYVSVTGLVQNGVDYQLSSFTTTNDLSGYLPLSGGTLSGELTLSDIDLRFNYGGWYWNINKFGNIFKGGAFQTVIHNQDIEIEGRPDTNCKINLNPVSGHLQYRGNNENTPGGFVIQDLSGNISLTGDIIQNGVNYDLSGFLSKFENFSLPSSGQEYLTQINVGGRNAISIYAGAGGFGYYTYIGSMYGFADIKGIAINLFYSGYLGLNGHHENTPGGFVIQDLSGKISAPYIEATSGLIENNVEYHLNSLQEKTEKIVTNEETITLSSNTYIKASEPLSSLTLTIPSGLTNSTIFFKTDDTFSFTIDAPSGAYINEDFDFGPSGAYLLSVEDEVILWSELIKRN